MRVLIIAKSTIDEFSRKDRSSSAPFKDWYEKILIADWDIPGDIISSFRDADILGKGSNRVVFNIGDNKYRMICHYQFGKRKDSSTSN